MGRELLRTAVAEARRLGVRALRNKTDPNADLFCRCMGAGRGDLEIYELQGTRRGVTRMAFVIPAVP